MIEIAICGDVMPAQPSAVDIIMRCAGQLGLEPPHVQEFASPLDLIDAVVNPPSQAAAPVDVVVCSQELSGMTGLQVASEVKPSPEAASSTPDGSVDPLVVLCAPDAGHAFDAQAARVDRYLVNPSESAFEYAISACLRDRQRLHGQSLSLRFRDKLRRIRFSQFLYAETDNHDQVVHLVGGQDYALRATSQELFDKLPAQGHFFKAGSSCIINLCQVRQVRSAGGAVVLSDGRDVSVPTRCRRQLEDALFELSAGHAAPAGTAG